MTITPVLFQVPAPYDANPWVHDDLRREMALENTPDPNRVWPAILQDYQGHENPAGKCPCGDELWYRARTGGHKCHGCLAYSNPQGVIIGAETGRRGARV